MYAKKKKIKKHYLKMLSVFFSFILWIYVVSSENVILEKNVLVKYKTPEGYTISSLAPTDLVYTLKGPRAFLRDYISKDNEVLIDLSSLRAKKKNQFLVNFKNLNFNLPFGIQMLSVNPERKTVNIEPEVKRLIPIEPVIIGTLDKDLKLTSSSLNRKKVLISGPSSILGLIKKITTRPINISDLKADGKLKVDLNLPDNRLVSMETEELFWEYNIRANKANKKLSNVPITFISSKFIKRSSLKYVDVVVLVNEDANMEEIVKGTKIIAELPDNASGKLQVKLKAQIPDSISLLEIRPLSIEVYVK